MKASALEFRLRYLLHVVVLGLGLFAPWDKLLHIDPAGPNAHTWGVVSTWLSEQHLLGIGSAFDVLLVIGIVCATLAAGLRTWGTAYLGSAVVEGGRMRAGIVTDGPFRFVRNPLYLGTLLHTMALALLMPPIGAVFSIVLIAILQVRLILGEEAFLTGQLGAEYLAYSHLVPRIVPSIRPKVAAGGSQPRWPRAFLVEIHMWGVAGSFAFAGWAFNASLLIRCTLVSMGVSLVIRALQPPQADSTGLSTSNLK